MISIIIPVLNQLEYTKQILNDITQKIKSEYEIIVIDDWSTDWTIEFLSKLENIRFYKNEKTWVNAARNYWVELAKWDYILIINNDIVLTDWIDLKIINWFEDNIKIVCPLTTRGKDKFKLPLFKKDDNIAWRCFMIENKNLFPIDNRLDIRYWDDYLFYKSNKQIKYIEWIIHHYESKTINSPEIKEQIQKRINKDKLNRQIILDENNRKNI